jgi:hypothetical protein
MRCEGGARSGDCCGDAAAALRSSRFAAASVERRKLNLKAKLKSSFSCSSFKRLVPGGFRVGFIEST